jgi:general secretion pathway protein K
MKHEERGAALLSVLMLVAVMAVLCATILARLSLATKLATNIVAADQARAFAMAGEHVARFRISDLIQRDPARTTLEGNWARRETNFPIDRGIASALLDDGGNCFNLNSLVIDDGQGGYLQRPAAIAQFVRLMEALDVPLSDAGKIAASTTDWIDSDTIALPVGAEDSSYQGFRTANVPMADISELRAVAGVTPAVYSRLKPYVCILPVTEPSPINANTLPPEKGALLAAIVPGLDSERARTLLLARPERGYENATRFWDQPAIAGASSDAKTQVRFSSQWFDLRIRIEMAGADFEQTTLIDARSRPARIVRRQFGEMN